MWSLRQPGMDKPFPSSMPRWRQPVGPDPTAERPPRLHRHLDHAASSLQSSIKCVALNTDLLNKYAKNKVHKWHKNLFINSRVMDGSSGSCWGLSSRLDSRRRDQRSPVHFFLKLHVPLHLLIEARVGRLLLLGHFLRFLLFHLHLELTSQWVKSRWIHRPSFQCKHLRGELSLFLFQLGQTQA